MTGINLLLLGQGEFLILTEPSRTRDLFSKSLHIYTLYVTRIDDYNLRPTAIIYKKSQRNNITHHQSHIYTPEYIYIYTPEYIYIYTPSISFLFFMARPQTGCHKSGQSEWSIWQCKVFCPDTREAWWYYYSACTILYCPAARSLRSHYYCFVV